MLGVGAVCVTGLEASRTMEPRSQAPRHGAPCRRRSTPVCSTTRPTTTSTSSSRTVPSRARSRAKPRSSSFVYVCVHLLDLSESMTVNLTHTNNNDNAADGRDHCRGAVRQRRLADLQASSAERRRAGPVRQPLRHRLAAGLDLLCRPLVQDRLALLPGPGLPTDRPTRRHQRSRVLCVRTMLDSNRDSLLVA